MLLQDPVYLAFNVVLLLISAIVLLIDGLAIVTLVMKSAIFVSLRILLINVLAAEILGTLAGMATILTTLVLLNANNVTPSLIDCRVNVWMFALSSAGRNFSLVAYSVAVLIVVKHSKRSLKVTFSITAVIIIWVLSLLFTIDRLIPQTSGVHFLEDIRCIPFSGDGVAIIELRIALRIFWFIFAGLVPLLIAIVIPIAGLRHINKTLETKSPIYIKAMMKLGLFLVLAESFSFTGTLILIIIPFLSQAQKVASVVAIYLLSITVTFSILPTPILLFGTLKATRTNLLRMMTCCCHLGRKNDANNDLHIQVHYRKVPD